LGGFNRLCAVRKLQLCATTSCKLAGGGIIEDKTAVEQMRLIQQLDEDDKQTIFKLIDKMLTNKKFKDFFQNNVAAL
jgi:hypothetical protein